MLVMDFAIPISHFNPKRVKLDQVKSCPLRKTISFAYEEDNINFTNLILVLHPLKVINVDMENKQIILEESNSSLLSKIEQLQTNINNELEKNPRRWLEQSKIPHIVKNPLQQWIKSKQFSLYLSSDPSLLSMFTKDGRVTFTEDILQPGDMVRILIKIHGLSLQMSEEDIWTGKSRIQHHILQIYKLTP